MEKSTPQPVHLTFISTGSVKIRPSMRSQPTTSFADKFVAVRRLRAFTDRQPILFDTGESPHVNDPGYLPSWCPTKILSSVTITPEDSIVNQLLAYGVDPKSLQAIVRSHLHGDHASGLKDLAEEAPHVPVYVSSEQWDTFGNSPFQATLAGCAPQHWPKDFKTKTIEFTDHPVGPWKQSGKITSDGNVVAVHTPGHVPGLIALVVFSDIDDGTQTTYFLPGDATYGVDLLDREEPDGINDDPMTALQSLKLIKEFARRTNLVVLPSHDPDVSRLLRDRQVYKPKS